MSMHDEKKKTWNWEKYVAWHVEDHIILGNLMDCGYQCLDPGSKVQYQLNGIRCNKLPTAVVAVNVHPYKYEKYFDTACAFLTQYINKRAPTPSVKVASADQNRPAKWQKAATTPVTFKGKVEL